MMKFQNQIQSGGVLFINSSQIQTGTSREDVEMVSVPADSLAEKLGSARSANMVMLGAFIKRSKLVSLASIIEGLKTTLKNKSRLIAVNEKALSAGHDLV